MTTILIVDVHAEIYRDRLRAEFPALQFKLFANAGEVAGAATGELSDIDVMVMFGIEVRDFMLSRRAAAALDPVAGHRRRPLPALPVA